MRPSLLALAALCVLVAISAAAAAGGPPPKAGFTAAMRADSGETSKGQNEPQVTVDGTGTAFVTWQSGESCDGRHGRHRNFSVAAAVQIHHVQLVRPADDLIDEQPAGGRDEFHDVAVRCPIDRAAIGDARGAWRHFQDRAMRRIPVRHQVQ